jgi:hypothetical protein
VARSVSRWNHTQVLMQLVRKPEEQSYRLHLYVWLNNVGQPGNLHIFSTPVDPNFEPSKDTLYRNSLFIIHHWWMSYSNFQYASILLLQSVSMVDPLGTAPRSRMFIVCFNDYTHTYTLKGKEGQQPLSIFFNCAF